MLFKKYFQATGTLGLALACVLAGCSTNAGFGTPVSGPNPVNNPYSQYAASPGPSVSGSIPPFESGPGYAAPEPTGSQPPTPTPAPNTLSIIGASLRLAYDGSAKDPVKAPRLLELSFALQNTTQNGAKVASVAVYTDNTALGTTPVVVTAAAGQTSEVMSVALKTSEDPLKYKELMLNFLDNSKKMIGSVKLDAPALETIFTSLDEKHPKGPFSIDSVEISHIGGGQGTHFECTFALTNASGSAVSVTAFAIKPPKGDAVKIAIPLGVPARSASGFISIVVPYNGKSLPAGNYSVSALENGATTAKASAVLL